jgi:hypothetical protein
LKDASTWPFEEDQFLLLNIAMGGIAGAVASNFTESSMLVDYVRVYQESTASITAGISLENRINVYPNPANGVINISTDVPVSKLILRDIYGKQVLRKSLQTQQLDVSKFSSGTYFLTIHSQKQKVVKRIVVR